MIFYTLIGLCAHSQNDESDHNGLKNIDQAWNVAWNRFFHPKTNLFYDYLSSYTDGKELAHLPTKEEVSRQYPNPCGYGTGMEDCMILAGVMLSAIVDRYEATKEESLKDAAFKIFEGLKLCSSIDAAPGFVARGICVEDGKSYYINSSRDQYTHCVHGLWKYYHSALIDHHTKKQAQRIIKDIADRMYRNVTPENNYDSLRADDERCPLGICRMWNVQSHEAARLPMIYAAAWDMTGDEKYYNLYRQYVTEAIQQSEHINDKHAAYVFLQMQCSFELLYALEHDPGLKDRLHQLKLRVAEMSLTRFVSCKDKLSRMDSHTLSMLGPDWRKVDEWGLQNGYNIPRWGEYRKVWDTIREAGETLTALLMVDQLLPKESQRELLNDLTVQMDYQHISSCGVIYHIAAFWKAY